MLEILAATAMFAVLIGAVYAVYYSTFRLREKSYEVLQVSLPRTGVAMYLENDLAAALPPGGLLAGSFIGEKHESGGRRMDTLEMHTASGLLNETDPWGDIQRVLYSLESPDGSRTGARASDYVLTRSVTRNLLASTEEEPETEQLIEGVQSLEFYYYDGDAWQESWDTTAMENEMPRAVKVTILLSPDAATNREVPPIELVVPVTVAKAAASEESTGGGAGGGSPSPTPTPRAK